MSTQKLNLVVLVLSFFLLSSCTLQTKNETQVPGQLNNLTTPTGTQTTISGTPTETDQQLFDKLNQETDPDIDKEFQQLNTDLQ